MTPDAGQAPMLRTNGASEKAWNPERTKWSRLKTNKERCQETLKFAKPKNKDTEQTPMNPTTSNKKHDFKNRRRKNLRI